MGLAVETEVALAISFDLHQEAQGDALIEAIEDLFVLTGRTWRTGLTVERTALAVFANEVFGLNKDRTRHHRVVKGTELGPDSEEPRLHEDLAD